MDNLIFKDEQNNKLYGFSQRNLDENTAETRRTRKAFYFLAVIIGIIGLIGMGYIFWLTYYTIKNNVLNNIVARCIK